MASLSLQALRQLALVLAIGSLAACGLLPSDPDDNDYSYAVGSNRDASGAGTPEAPPVETAPQPPADDYVVQRGDTMYSIAFHHGMDWRALAELNGIGAPYTIRPGQPLRLHAPAPEPTRVASEPARPVSEPPRVATAEPPRTRDEPPRGAEARPLRDDRAPPQQLQVETVTAPPRQPPAESTPNPGEASRRASARQDTTVAPPDLPLPPAEPVPAATDRNSTVVLAPPPVAGEPAPGTARTQGVADAGTSGGRVEALPDSPSPAHGSDAAPRTADDGRARPDSALAVESAATPKAGSGRGGALAQAVGPRTRPGASEAARPADSAPPNTAAVAPNGTVAAPADNARAPATATAAPAAKPESATSPSPPAEAAEKSRPAVASISHVDPSAVLVGPKRTVDGVAWQWPASGTLISRFLPGDNTHQGIEVAGKEGSGVHAAADGEVVYSGNGLVGYGELIIIKHNNEFLSAYARNSRRLVKEGDKVKAGQAIAEIGRGGSTVDAVHFEIRRAGKPDDPLKYLPARN